MGSKVVMENTALGAEGLGQAVHSTRKDTGSSLHAALTCVRAIQEVTFEKKLPSRLLSSLSTHFFC